MAEHFHAVMDRNIFRLGLSVEATSAYIVVTSVQSEDRAPAFQDLSARWTLSDEALVRALEELIRRDVVRTRTGPDGLVCYLAQPSSMWRPA